MSYCSMIHGGLSILYKKNQLTVGSCCLRYDSQPVDTQHSLWNQPLLQPMRDLNRRGQYDSNYSCRDCATIESMGYDSFRSGMNKGLGIEGKYDLTGPARLDLGFDNSCNLACMICGPDKSTLWQKHLKAHGEWMQPIDVFRNKETVIKLLGDLDLSNLKQVVFSGGETLLGQEYWAVAKWLVDNVPDAKQRLTLCFQTNGTQDILPRNYEIIEKAQLVKLHISLDGINERFNYQRWPGDWNQVENNLFGIRDNCPGNVMFLIEETISIFNLLYQSELENWIKDHFATNREGDPVNHTKHLVKGIFGMQNLTQEYVDTLQSRNLHSFIPKNWRETPYISDMIQQIRKFDSYREQDFTKVFPEVAQLYNRYL